MTRQKKCPRLILRQGKEASVKRRHPWIFSGALRSVEGSPAEGDQVDVFDSRGSFLATGHYQKGSIAVRILAFEPLPVDQDFYTSRIREAFGLRQILGLAGNGQTNMLRLVHGEGDGLPGLVTDIYHRTAVIQMHSVGMYRAEKLIVHALREVLDERLDCIYNKSEQTLPFKAFTGAKDRYLLGERDPSPVMENGLRFRVDWEKGQKTGFFIDQRDNRRLLEQYAPGRKVLNMFAYTGAFSVYALRGGASLVHTVDSSAGAIAMAEENAVLNFPGTTVHKTFTAGASAFFRGTEEMYDLIVVDPPAFAKHGSVLKNALLGYRNLNAAALSRLGRGGVLFSFSCSQAVSSDDFRRSVFVAAASTGRQVRILHQLRQPPDHPVSIYHPEGEYLKGLVLWVE